MKEATGELNATVIIFTAVALLTVVFFMVVWPLVKDGFYESASCANAVCDNGYITDGEDKGKAYCISPQDDRANPEVFTCPFRG
jgi:hypothetical protein